jgi:hypothetical protein
MGLRQNITPTNCRNRATYATIARYQWVTEPPYRIELSCFVIRHQWRRALKLAQLADLCTLFRGLAETSRHSENHAILVKPTGEWTTPFYLC